MHTHFNRVYSGIYFSVFKHLQLKASYQQCTIHSKTRLATAGSITVYIKQANGRDEYEVKKLQ